MSNTALAICLAFSRVLLAAGLIACRERADVESPKVRGAVPLPLSKPAGPGPMLLGGTAALETQSPEAPKTGPTVATALEPRPPLRVVLAAGGDVNFGRECGQAILKDPAYDPFAGLGQAWTSADLRFVNLESQLSEQNGVTQNPRHRLIFTGPPGGAEVLARARISAVSLANNHAWDYGKSAFFETLANLERAGVAYSGAGRDPARAYGLTVLRASGISIALFSVTHIWNQGPFAQHEGRDFVAWADPARLKPGIEQARREHDFVLVSYHGGAEYVDAPVDRTRRFVTAVMALGVDAVIGHHPHVLQGVGWFGSRPALYSLGNFVFAGHDDRPWTKQSFFARLTLEKGRPIAVRACPFALAGHQPRSLSRERDGLAFERFRRHLIGTSTSVGGSDVGDVDDLGCLPVTAKAPQPALSSSN